jgi:hypothetical protein
MRILLLDLNETLSSNRREVFGASGRPGGYGQAITEVEQYRGPLIEWLRGIQADEWEVHLFTVRLTEHRDRTLESIRRKTGWVPDNAWFNDTGVAGQEAKRVKGILLDRVLESCTPTHLYALESNVNVHSMFKRRGVPHQRGDEPLPGIARLERDSRRHDP